MLKGFFEKIKRRLLNLFGPDRFWPRLFLLTFFKEGYLLLANTYGFFTHPRRTFLKLKKDRSQMALFVSLGFSAFLFFGVAYWALRRFWV